MAERAIAHPEAPKDPYRPLTKQEWQERLDRAEEDFKQGRVRDGFEVYKEMKEKYGL